MGLAQSGSAHEQQILAVRSEILRPAAAILQDLGHVLPGRAAQFRFHLRRIAVYIKSIKVTQGQGTGGVDLDVSKRQLS